MTSMTLQEFRATLSSDRPPAAAPPLIALWHDARGNWDEAHRIVGEVETKDAAWVHAYLHRKEGDPGNAAYWYDRAGQTVASDSLEAEWNRIVAALLAQ